MFRTCTKPLKRLQTRNAFIDPIQATFSNVTPQELRRLASVVNNTNNVRIKVMTTQKVGYIQVGASEIEFSLEKVPEGLRLKERRRNLPPQGEAFFDTNRENLLSMLDDLEKCANANEMQTVLRDFRFNQVGTKTHIRLRRPRNPRSLRGSTHDTVLGNGSNAARHKRWGPDDKSASQSKKFWWVKDGDHWNSKPPFAPMGKYRDN